MRRSSILDIIFLGILLCFAWAKYADLNLPFFWDEAWSYVPAISTMAESGPSLMPNSIDPELYRGHPLLFYCLSSIWMSVMGDSSLMMKLFPFILSLLLLWGVYRFCLVHFDRITGVVSVLFLIIQSVFFVQSSMLLPEVMLALFTLFALHAWVSRSHLWSIFWLTLALLTKESGLVIWFVLLLCTFYRLYSEDKKWKIILVETSKYLFPLFPLSVFLVLQKSILGWYFFPEHLSLMNMENTLHGMEMYAAYIFIYMGRNVLTFVGVGCLIFLFFKRRKDLADKKEVMVPILIFTIGYLLFCGMNFYSPRYLLSILPLVIMIWVYGILKTFNNMHRSISISVFTILFMVNTSKTLTKKGGNDHTLGMNDLINVQKDMSHFLVEQGFDGTSIFTHFLMKYYLTHPRSGYVEKEFEHVHDEMDRPFSFAVVSSNELNWGHYENIKKSGKLIARFEVGKSWSELYSMDSD